MLADYTFQYNGKTYEAIKPAHIPELGKLTPGDIALDPDAQKYLIENGCSAVKEIE